ncbi:MAG: hypothetical protein HQL95_12520, partial [Magnetococcales bacterium]|nr:hypothetical protein [Magnetococcales bacterium]
MSEDRVTIGGTDSSGIEEDRQNLDDMTVLQHVKSVDLSAEENRNAESQQITDQLVVMGSVQMGSRTEVEHTIATSIDMDSENQSIASENVQPTAPPESRPSGNEFSVEGSGEATILPLASASPPDAGTPGRAAPPEAPEAGESHPVTSRAESPPTVEVNPPPPVVTVAPVIAEPPVTPESSQPRETVPVETERAPDPGNIEVIHPIRADGATLAVTDAAGLEDQGIPLRIEVTQGDAGESLTVYIEGVPSGSVLSAGEDLGDGRWALRGDALQDLVLTPPANSDEDFALTVRTVTTESATGETATSTQVLHVTVDAVADIPTLALQDAAGNEDQTIPLNLSAMLTDTDGSESLSITIAGVPTGATLSAGIDNHDGTWSLTSEQLQGLSLHPPANSDQDFTLSITATSTEAAGGTASQSGTLTVSLAPEADIPTLVLQDAAGSEDQTIPLNLSAMLTDTDGSESLSIT